MRSTKISFDIFIEIMFAFLLHLLIKKFKTESYCFERNNRIWCWNGYDFELYQTTFHKKNYHNRLFNSIWLSVISYKIKRSKTSYLVRSWLINGKVKLKQLKVRVKQKASHRVHPTKINFFDQLSKLHTECVFKNIKVKAPIDYQNETTQLKGSITRTCPKVFQEFGKICEIARRASVI